MRYRNLDFQVASDGRGGYTVGIVGSLYGRADAAFVPPYSQEILRDLLTGFERSVRGSGARRRARGSPRIADPAPPDIERLGEALFASLAVAGVRDRLEAGRFALAGRNSPEGLRLRLQFDGAAAPHAALPWELMRHPETRQYLGLRRETPIVRLVPVALPPREPLSGGLRVLVVNAAPHLATKFEDEWRGIEEAVRSQPAIEVERMAGPTLGELRSRMLDGGFHVLHLVGHGDFAPESGEGRLLFQPRGRRSELVSGRLLGELLGSLPELRLVVVNACDTGAVARRDGQDPYRGMAAALVLAEAPAVVAMQFPISNRAAIAFSSKLYDRLAVHDPVEAAVVEARLAILAEGRRPFEWAIPVLFARDAGDGLVLPEPRADDEHAAPAIVQARRRLQAEGPVPADEEVTPPLDIAGRYAVEGDGAEDAAVQHLSGDRFRLASRSLAGAGIFRTERYLGVYREATNGTWGILHGSPLRGTGLALHGEGARGATAGIGEIWWRRSPATGGRRTKTTVERFRINGVAVLRLLVTRLKDGVLLVETPYWQGVGLLHEGHYLGVYKYTAGVLKEDWGDASWLRVWGSHEGELRADGVLEIHGRNLFGKDGEFDVTWEPAPLPSPSRRRSN